jgi:glycosyltransferase involved in cell wall biosynthesis
MRKKRILFMAQLPPPVHGAALRNKSLLDSQLMSSEFEIISLPLRFIDDMKDMGKFSFKKIFLMLRHAFQMLRIFCTRKIHLVYFTMSPSGFAFYRDILFITIIKIFGRKRLLHFRVKGLQETAKSSVGKFLIRYAFKNSDIVCLSKHHTDDMQGLVDRSPFIVPNGIKIEKEFLHLADEYKFDQNKITKLLFLSNLSLKKGVPELITALGILRKRNYSFHTSIVGNEWYMTFAEAQKLIDDEGLTDEVKLEGPKFGKDKFTFLAEADIFIFPTYFELFPGVILEAMQFGKAIVSTFEGSIPDIVDNGVNGLLVKRRDAEALAEAIAFLIDNPDKRFQFAAAAKEKFFKEFTLEAFERRMHAVFEEVINK